jgi:poly-gamma-glutamate capsule biosynthesis protein CapA/YwtB (metallophosphatase superfamily)
MSMPIGGNYRVKRPTAAFRFLFAVSAMSLLVSCASRRIEVNFDAEPELMPRLQGILAESPPPDAWKIRSDSGKAAYRISLEIQRPGKTVSADSALCGTVYYAASVELSDRLYSVSSGRAEQIGLVPLESIVPPRRALAVDEALPGSAAYPFTHSLTLTASAPRGSALPAEIGQWLHTACARASAFDTAPILLTAVGDMQVGEAQGPTLLGGEEGLGDLMSEEVLERLRLADVAVGNLESPVSSRGKENPKKRYHFRMPPGASSALKDAGFDLVLFGNNHAFDFGPEAFADTLADLDTAALPMVGAGSDIAEASKARVLELKRGERLAFIGFAFFPNENSGFTAADAAARADRPGINADADATIASIRAAAASGATVVVLGHGGVEYNLHPSDEARRLYHRFIDAGAALILGSHPHLLQGCEARSGSFIAYSLGNFLFTLEDEPPEAWKGAMLDLLIYRGKVRGVMPRPIIAGYYGTRLDPDAETARRRFSKLCSDVEALPPLKSP